MFEILMNLNKLFCLRSVKIRWNKNTYRIRLNSGNFVSKYQSVYTHQHLKKYIDFVNNDTLISYIYTHNKCISKTLDPILVSILRTILFFIYLLNYRISGAETSQKWFFFSDWQTSALISQKLKVYRSRISQKLVRIR